jgi:hypothetical protein
MMEVRWKDGPPLQICEAIDREIAYATVPEVAASRVLSLLIETLAEKGLLSTEEVLRFLPKHYQVYKQPDSR